MALTQFCCGPAVTCRSVSKASAGDRVGICVAQLDPKAIERGLAAAPGTVPTFNAAIARVDKIRFYAGEGQELQ